MKIKKFILALIFLAAFIVRFYDLGVVPAGLAQDETSIGYNAYSILQTGKDEYGQVFPLAFKAFGEYKLPGYIYLTVPSIAYFGTTPLGVRFPSAVFGFLTVIVFYFLVKNLTKNEQIAIFAAFLLAINPWHVHFSRAAFEVVPALFFIVTGAYLLIKYLDTRRSIYFILSSCLFVLSIYTYNICRVFAPVFFITLVIFYRKELSLKKVGFWLLGLPALVLLIPFLITILTPGGFASTKGTLLYSSAPVQAQLLEMRSIVLIHSPILAKLFFNQWILTSFEYIKNIVNYFSTSFFFVTGSEHGNHGIGNVGMFYIFEFITILVGIITYIKKQQSWGTLLIFWAIIGILVAAFTREAPQATRGFFLIPPAIIFSAYGFYKLWLIVSKLSMPISRTIVILSILFIGFNIFYYFTSYYFRFPLLYGSSWRSEDKNLIDYIKTNQNNYDKIIFDNETSFIYTSLLYYLPYSPVQFQIDVKRGPDDSEGFSKVHEFGKFEFKSLDWSKINDEHNALIITLSKNIPQNVEIIKTFYYPERPVVIARGQELLQFPTKDVAYVLVKIK